MVETTCDANLIYPVIVEHFNDEDGEYYVATSPNIKGLVTQGDTINELVANVQDAIGGWIDGKEYPKVEDPTKWKLSQNQQVMWVTVDMNDWRRQSQKQYIEQCQFQSI